MENIRTEIIAALVEVGQRAMYAAPEQAEALQRVETRLRQRLAEIDRKLGKGDRED